MNVVTLDPVSAELPEPDWTNELPGRSQAVAGDRLNASRYWGTIIRELRSTDRLALVNAHAVKRLVLAWTLYDRASAEVAKHGAVVPAPRTKTPMHSPWFTAMMQAGKMAASLEAELTITPRTRDDGVPVPKPPRGRTKADDYLRRNVPNLLPPASHDGEPDASA